MSSDEGDEKHEALAPEGTPPASKAIAAVTPGAVAAAAGDTPSAGQAGLSEWTASDARGPLAAPVLPAEAAPPRPKEATGVDGEPRLTAGAQEDGTPPPDTPASHDTSLSDGAPAGPEVKTPARRQSVWPIVAAIVVGALIGAGANELTRMRGASGGVLRRELAALKIRVDQLSRVPAGAAAGEGSDLSGIKAAVAELSVKTAATESGLQKLQVAAPADKTGAVNALDDKVAALQTALLSVQSAQGESAAGLKATGDKLAALDAGLAKVQSQAAAAQSDLDALRTQQKSLEGKTNAPALAVLAESLNERVERGQPFTAETSALASVDADPAKLAVLRPLAAQGVPTANDLAVQFDALSERLEAAAHQLPPGASYWDRLKEGASSLVTIHKAGDTSATDPASRLAEIKDALRRGDVTGAASFWAKLPASMTAKPEASVFAAALNAHAEASLAAKAIENAAIAALGAKKS